MTRSRFAILIEAATFLRKLALKYAAVPMKGLPIVTLEESAWLSKHKPGLLPFTKLACCEVTGWKSIFVNTRDEKGLLHGHLTSAKRPIIREIWVGARSPAAIGESESSEGHQHSQTEQEDVAEVTDLMTMLYGDPKFAEELIFQQACDTYLKALTLALLTCAWRVNLSFCKHLWKKALMQAQYDNAHTAVIEDPESSKPRLIRVGDIIQTAWGSNENLDAMYLEEPANERSESDSIEREIARDQIRANTYHEQCYLTGGRNPNLLPPVMHIKQLRESEMFPEQDNFRLRQQAGRMVDEFAKNNPDDIRLHTDSNGRSGTLALYDLAFSKLKNDDLEWVNAQDFWEQIDRNTRSRKAPHLLRTAKPKPTDWDAIRGAHSHGTRAVAV